MALEIASKEDFQRLENKLDEFLVELKLFNNRLLIPKVVTTKDICIMEGISKTKVCKEKYYLPRFGESAYEGIAKWDLSEYLEWRKRPNEERKREYQEMTFRKNQRSK